MNSKRTFSGIVGHRRQKAVLERAITLDAVAPAWLFYGPEGTGKMTVAGVFASALLCAAPEGGACGSCPSCRAVDGGTHPDLLVLHPDAKTPKGPRSLRIEHVRNMQEFLALRPGMGRRRVCLLDGVETLNVVAANALLKTLEEPPGETAIVLVTSSPGRLPPTIHSRCRSIGFAGLKDDEVKEVLESLGWAPGEIEEGVRAAEGSPGAVHALRGKGWEKAAGLARSFGSAVSDGGESAYGFVEGLGGGREEAGLVLRLLLAGVAREIRGRIGAAEAGDGRSDPALEGLSLDGLTGQMENLLEMARMLEGNVNVKLSLGVLCRRWAEGIDAGVIRPLQREW